MNLPTAHRRGTRTIDGVKVPVYEIEGHTGLWTKTDDRACELLPWDSCEAVLTYRGTKRELVFARVI
jgi:hypothetical protein